MKGHAPRRWVAFFFLILASVLLVACERAQPGVSVAGGCFVIEGEFWRPEFEAFERLYVEHPGIRCLELRGSPGGATLAGLRIGAMAQARGMRTVARGACVSACALAFLGGAERELGPPWRGAESVLQLHGSFDRRSGKPDDTFRAPVAAWIIERTAGRTSPRLVRALIDAPEPAAGLYASATSARLCRAAPDAADLRSCEPLVGANALSLGLTTRSTGPRG